MAFPEDWFVQRFWYFLRGMTHDPRVSDPDTSTPSNIAAEILTGLEFIENASLTGPRKRIKFLGYYVVYPTLQDALLGYLLYLINEARPPGGGKFACTYEIWLRTVTLILAEAVRDPSQLEIQIGDFEDPPIKIAESTMTISNDWTVLSRETFDYAIASFAGTKLSDWDPAYH